MQVHTHGYVPTDQESEAGKHFMAGYKAVTQLDRWKVNDGADFVFFDPHQGFTDGTSDSEFKKFLCQTSKNSMHIVSERGQLNLCQVLYPYPLCKHLEMSKTLATRLVCS